MSGLRKPRKPTTPGSEIACDVTAIGPAVSRLAVGDRVVGSTGASLGAGIGNVGAGLILGAALGVSPAISGRRRSGHDDK